MVQFNVQQLKNIKKIGEGNFGQVTLTRLEHKPNVIFACKVSLTKYFIYMWINKFCIFFHRE